MVMARWALTWACVAAAALLLSARGALAEEEKYIPNTATLIHSSRTHHVSHSTTTSHTTAAGHTTTHGSASHSTLHTSSTALGHHPDAIRTALEHTAALNAHANSGTTSSGTVAAESNPAVTGMSGGVTSATTLGVDYESWDYDRASVPEGANCDNPSSHTGVKIRKYTTDSHSTRYPWNHFWQRNYQNNKHRCWMIKPKSLVGSSGRRVKLHFPKMNLELGQDTVRVYDLVGNKLMDEEADTQTTYYSDKGFFIYFHSDEAVTAKGFMMEYSIQTGAEERTRNEEVIFYSHLDENHKACHTSQFEKDGTLVARRGCTFKLSVSGGAHVKQFNFRLMDDAGIDPWSQQPNSQLEESTDYVQEIQAGRAVPMPKFGIKEVSKNVFEFTVPINMPVGRYDIDFVGHDGRVYADTFSTAILFNPWDKREDVYINKPAWLQEFVLNTRGYEYVGSAGNWNARPFNFDQFTSTSLIGAVRALRGLSYNDRMWVVKVARYYSWVANNQVLRGQWQEPYAPYTKPWDWTNSGQIVAQWVLTGQMVKYGQCWVFSAVTTTLSRAMGIPTRSVTNFNSAHEKPRVVDSTSVTTFLEVDSGVELAEEAEVKAGFGQSYKGFDGIVDEFWTVIDGNWRKDALPGAQDSIWNFHVWNEGWFTRRDLHKEYGQVADGWQAFDGTCQEMSDGRCQNGPASKNLLQRGKLTSAFDAQFILGEVNADRRFWVRYGEHQQYRVLKVDHHHIGKLAVTKDVGSNKAVDVSKGYKIEGANAITWGPSFRELYEKEMQFSTSMGEKSIWVGNSIVWTLKVTKPDLKEKRTVSVTFTAEPETQKGDSLFTTSGAEARVEDERSGQLGEDKDYAHIGDLKKEEITIELHESDTEGMAEFKLLPEDYASMLGQTRSILFRVVVEVKETSQKFINDESLEIQTPSIRISGPSNVTVGDKKNYRFKWANPFSLGSGLDFRDCVMKWEASGSAFDSKMWGVEFSNILAGTEAIGRAEGAKKFKCSDPDSTVVLLATLSCDNLIGAVGIKSINCLSRTKKTAQVYVSKKGRKKIGFKARKKKKEEEEEEKPEEKPKKEEEEEKPKKEEEEKPKKEEEEEKPQEEKPKKEEEEKPKKEDEEKPKKEEEEKPKKEEEEKPKKEEEEKPKKEEEEKLKKEKKVEKEVEKEEEEKPKKEEKKHHSKLTASRLRELIAKILG